MTSPDPLAVKNFSSRTLIFLAVVFLLTAVATWLVLDQIVFTSETFLLSSLWVIGFTILFFNVSYLFCLSLAHPFLQTPVLKEAQVSSYPKTAFLYPIRNEEHGLYERIHFSLEGNRLPNLDLWILSDSDASFETGERSLQAKLKAHYGSIVYYRRRIHPVERKQGNIKEFLESHPEYQYIYVADADGMVPEGVIEKLLRKAAHPDNQDVAIFQCFAKIAHAHTWYARFERNGSNLAQRFNFVGLQAIFGRAISFGHHHLARTSAVRKINLPKGLLSHDNWDTVLLDEMGWRVVFCPDVVGFDEAPANYLEAKSRASRWAQGTLQGWPLVLRKKTSLASRFFAAYGIYLYLADIVFFSWVLLGLLSHSFVAGELIHFKVDAVWGGHCTNQLLSAVLAFSVFVVFFHKLVILDTWEDVRHYIYELIISGFVTLNNFFYSPLHILSIPLKKLKWRPMAKNPFERLSLAQSVYSLWPGTMLGLCGLYFCVFLVPYFVWQLTPILTSLIFSIPAVYLTAQAVPASWRAWV